MGIIINQFETEYNVNEIVIFKKNGILQVGIVEGYYTEDNCIWYNIRVSETLVYTYNMYGDIPEFDIICKIEGLGEDINDKCLKTILGKDDD